MPANYEVTIGLTIEEGRAAWTGASCVRDKVEEFIKSGALRHTLSAGGAEIAYVEYRDASDDANAQLAENAAQKRYMDDVRGVVEEFIEMAKDGDFDDDEDAAGTWLHETIDGHGRVMFTAKAQECLYLSSNDSAYIDEHGAEGIATNDGINWSTLAYSAFRADINALLDAHGVEPSDPDTWRGDDEDDEDNMVIEASGVDYPECEEDDDIDPSECAYTASELRDLETLSQGQTCDLKMESERFRVWLSRCTVADGEPYDNKVTVEELENGRWVTRCTYEG